jgi:anti-repressor protein
MNEIIAISNGNIGGNAVQTVNARDLHAFLGNKDKFATWIKDRISQFDFLENHDFVIYSENPEKGRPSVEYALTLSMGKELAMVERNAKGKEARLYFIECEKRALASFHQIPQTFAEALQLAADQAKQLAEAQPKIEAFETFLSCKNAVPFNEAAKVLGTGRTRLFQFCRENGILMKEGVNYNLPSQPHMDRGLFEVREVTIRHSDWQEAKRQPLVTMAGMDYLRRKLAEDKISKARKK